ncbi:MAG: transcriptional regulator, partial [Kiritimatiellae bacterium]|nr:transcriptional regulator [Kiritimatiellia bacterium]
NIDLDKDFNELAIALSKMSDPEEISQFLREICSPAECKSIASRWQLMKLLELGETQRAIAKKLHLSLCKITRGAKYLKDESSLLRREVKKVTEKRK